MTNDTLETETHPLLILDSAPTAANEFTLADQSHDSAENDVFGDDLDLLGEENDALDDEAGEGESAKRVFELKDPFNELVDAAERHLARKPGVFHRADELMYINRDDGGRVRLQPLKSNVTQYFLARGARLVKEGKPVHPPPRVAQCLLEKTTWRYVRPLRALSPFPPLAHNGSLTTSSGYDATTRVYFAGDVKCQPAENPTRELAQAAIETLFDVVCDFPFASPAHRAAWLAALLSPLSRFAHDGNVPFVVVQANCPRVGKTSLVNLISHIVTGAECSATTHTKNDDEMRKRILATLRAARPMVLIDNVVGQFGSASLNALATSPVFEDRVLGHSKTIQARNDATWFVTGNRITLAPDTAERCLHVRLRYDNENPHLRTEFKHGDIFGMVKQRRAELLTASLTILKAYMVAGTPDVSLSGWGSFGSWSRLVRGALVWAGQPDPASTRAELERDADVDRRDSRSLVDAWFAAQTATKRLTGMTAGEAIELATTKRAKAAAMRSALEDISGAPGQMPTAHALGRHLREARDRNLGGRILRCAENKKTAHRWYVEIVRTPKAPGAEGTGG